MNLEEDGRVTSVIGGRRACFLVHSEAGSVQLWTSHREILGLESSMSKMRVLEEMLTKVSIAVTVTWSCENKSRYMSYKVSPRV